jgi:ferredoxin
MTATVDGSLCEGCGICEETCPEVFELGDDGLAKLKVETVPDDAQDACRDAAEQCPTEAITISE